MLDRAIENWLTNASERSFQLPFCYMLQGRGHSIIHVSRHCGMELGKDVLTIDGDGVPCAFQLKGGNISLKKWKDEISSQVVDLIYGSLAHPAIGQRAHHRSFLVTNGKIEEEVWRAIDDVNAAAQSRGFLPLEVYVDGNLLEMALELRASLWPSELVDVKSVLEFLLEPGTDVLDKARLSSLLESTLPLNKEKVSKAECKRAITSAALLCAIATSNHTQQRNHVAEVEAWTVYTAYVLALAEKWRLPPAIYSEEVDLAIQIIRTSLTNLAEEVQDARHLVEGDVLVDSPVYQIRLTWLMGMLGVLGLWRVWDKEKRGDVDEFIRQFTKTNMSNIGIWGEAMIPQFLALYWYRKRVDAPIKVDFLLRSVIEVLSSRNRTGSNTALASPYYEAKDILPHFIDYELSHFLPSELRIADTPLDASFAGTAYTVEGLMLLFAKRGFKQSMKTLWPQISYLSFNEFRVKEPWQYLLWRSPSGGERSVMPSATQSWKELQERAFAPAGITLPDSLKLYPLFMVLFLLVYPHRLTTDAVLWLDSALRKY